LVSIVGAIVVGIVVTLISIVLGFIPCIGWVLMWLISALSSVYLFVVYAYLFGQVAAPEATSVTITEPEV
jgi:hypothetical protein